MCNRRLAKHPIFEKGCLSPRISNREIRAISAHRCSRGSRISGGRPFGAARVAEQSNVHNGPSLLTLSRLILHRLAQQQPQNFFFFGFFFATFTSRVAGAAGAWSAG